MSAAITALHGLHTELEGHMVDFAGWDLPVQFGQPRILDCQDRTQYPTGYGSKAARDNPIAPKGIFSFLAGPDMDEIKAKRAKDKAKADPYQKRNKSGKDKKKK